MLKHIPRVVLVPPPTEEDKKETWGTFSELIASDVELISEITEGNHKIAFLNNQQLRCFKELVISLNSSISPYNIDKVFKIFEVPFFLRDRNAVEHIRANHR